MIINDNDIKEMVELQQKMQFIVDTQPEIASLIVGTASKQEAFCCGMALATVVANKSQDELMKQIDGLVSQLEVRLTGKKRT